MATRSQFRARIAARERIDQPLERLFDPRLRRLDAGAPGPGTTDPVARLDPALDLPASLAGGLAGQPRGQRHQRITAQPRLRDSAAAHRRRPRSSSTDDTAANFATTFASSVMSRFMPPEHHTDPLASYFAPGSLAFQLHSRTHGEPFHPVFPGSRWPECAVAADLLQRPGEFEERSLKNMAMLSDFYCAALPSVRDRPLRTMPASLYGYVFKVSAKQQVRLCLLTVLVFPLTLVPLELQRRIVDGAIAGQDVNLLILLGVFYFVVVAGQGILKFLRNIYLNRVAEGVIRILRMRIAHTEEFDTDPDEGTTQSIISSEAEKVGGFVAEAIALPLLQVGIVLSIAGYMLVVEPIIAAVAIVFLVPSMIIVAASQPVLNRLSEKKITAARDLGQCVLSDGRDEAGKDADPDGFIERIYRLRVRFGIVKNSAKGLSNLINHIGPLSVLMVGGWLVIQERTEIGTIVAFMSGYQQMTSPVHDLFNFYRRLAMMRVQYRLVYDAAQSSDAGAA